MVRALRLLVACTEEERRESNEKPRKAARDRESGVEVEGGKKSEARLTKGAVID